jgi:hypothetical protein
LERLKTYDTSFTEEYLGKFNLIQGEGVEQNGFGMSLNLIKMSE